MRLVFTTALAMAIAAPALADTQIAQLGSHNRGAAFTFDGFNAALGTLQSVQFNLSGSSTISLDLGQPTSGPVNYSASNDLFLYVSSPNVQPAIALSGSGSATANGGGHVTFTTANGAISSDVYTNSADLQAFSAASIGAYFTIDTPTQLSVTYNGNPIAYSNVAIDSGFGGGSVIYTYAANGRAVPEPASWAMALAGFGMVGGALRRARTGRVLHSA